MVLAGDLWSLNQEAGAGDSDSAHQSSSLTSVGVSSRVRTCTPDNTDNHVYDTDRALHNMASTTRSHNTTCDRLPGTQKPYADDGCYTTLADDVTAGAYQIKLDDRGAVLSC